jgi:hypothetical protein
MHRYIRLTPRRKRSGAAIQIPTFAINTFYGRFARSQGPTKCASRRQSHGRSSFLSLKRNMKKLDYEKRRTGGIYLPTFPD